jgi:beta-lactamase superfamily II metal-dependent hydrolase
MKLTIEALQANDGDCLLLHYERAGAAPVRILVDGGSRGVYSNVLRGRVDELRGADALNLRMVMVSHIDADHITGLLDLFRDLERAQENSEDPFCRIRTLWHNSFERIHQGKAATVQSAAVSATLGGVVAPGLEEKAAAVVASVRQGSQLRDLAERLGIPINEGAIDPLVRAPESGVRRITVAPGLQFSILGPREKQLQRLDEEWRTSKASNPSNPAAQAADYLNRTVPNLSSIVVLLEASRGNGAEPVRFLLTGDAGGDHIVQSLEATGLGPDGRIHVDLLKVQHHGSNHSTTQDFFERVTADHYVISGNGKHGNPHRDTLTWLSAARRDQAYDVYLTNRDGEEGLKKMFDRFLEAESATQPMHCYHFRDTGERSISRSFG